MIKILRFFNFSGIDRVVQAFPINVHAQFGANPRFSDFTKLAKMAPDDLLCQVFTGQSFNRHK